MSADYGLTDCVTGGVRGESECRNKVVEDNFINRFGFGCFINLFLFCFSLSTYGIFEFGLEVRSSRLLLLFTAFLSQLPRSVFFWMLKSTSRWLTIISRRQPITIHELRFLELRTETIS